MTLRQHATNIVDHAIRIALISLLAVPVWAGLWFAACGFIEPPPSGSGSDLICRAVAFPGLTFLSPAFAAIKLLEVFGVPSSFALGVFHWLLACVSVPTFWGGVSYGVVFLCRRWRSHAKA